MAILFQFFLNKFRSKRKGCIAQSAGAVEYTDCISAEE